MKVPHPQIAVILLGTDPHLSRGGIASVLPSYLSLLESAGIPHRFLPTHSNDRFTGKFRHFALAIPKMLSAIRDYSAQGLTPIVHAHAGQWPSLIRKRAMLSAAKIAGAKTVLHLHGAEIEDYTQSASKRAALTALLHGLDLILTLTPYWAELMSKVTRTPIKILPNPLSPQLTKQAAAPFVSRNGKTRLLSMNRLIPGKGYEFLVEVLSKLPPTASLTIAGEGELLDSLKMLAQNLKCADRITFPGWVSGAEKQALFDESDAFCLFTLRDCMSTVLLEAMANGLPIVAYEYGPTLDLVPRSAGIFVKPEESAEHAAGLIQNLNPSQKTQMGMAAKRWVLENYSAEIVTREWLALLSQLAVETGENRRVAT